MITTKNNIYLAPLDNVNCASFRLLCKECGAGLVSTPMINTKSFIRERENFYWYKNEQPLLAQFIGSEPDEFKECVQELDNCDVIDLNAGCPSDDQIKAGNGAALLKDLPLMKRIIKTMVKYSPVPVSVKIRKGWEEDDCIKIGLLIEAAGAEFITLHPRTKFEGYGTPADWSAVKKLKKSVKIPVIASGDLLTPENVKECFDKTECDAVMIGRAAINNPFIFRDSEDYLKTNELVKHSKIERINLIKRFIELYHKYEKRYDLAELRNHCAWLVKEFKGARKLRDNIGRCKTEEEILKII